MFGKLGGHVLLFRRFTQAFATVSALEAVHSPHVLHDYFLTHSLSCLFSANPSMRV
jgi:hypothetical protein